MFKPARQKYKISVLLLSSIISACASSSGGKGYGLFDTTVKSGDIRLFRYTLPLFREQPRPITARDQNRVSQGVVSERESIEAQLKRADYYLQRDPRLKKYCPNGYVHIDKYAVLNEIIIRGECMYGESPP
jgi:hypothetical protein